MQSDTPAHLLTAMCIKTYLFMATRWTKQQLAISTKEHIVTLLLFAKENFKFKVTVSQLHSLRTGTDWELYWSCCAIFVPTV